MSDERPRRRKRRKKAASHTKKGDRHRFPRIYKARVREMEAKRWDKMLKRGDTPSSLAY